MIHVCNQTYVSVLVCVYVCVRTFMCVLVDIALKNKAPKSMLQPASYPSGQTRREGINIPVRSGMLYDFPANRYLVPRGQRQISTTKSRY